MVVVELLDREVVGHDGAVETPLGPQEIGQQPAVRRARDPVELLVRVHHRRQTRVAHGGLERAEVHVAQLTFRDMRGRPVHATFGCAVSDEVLRRGDDAVAQVRAVVTALKPGR